MTRQLIVPMLLAVVAGAACAKKDSDNIPAAAREAAASAPAPPLPPSATSVDVCAMLSRADVESVIGKLTEEPKASAAQGSLLGECTYTSVDVKAIPIKVALVSVSARPAGEFEGSVQAFGKSRPMTPVPGLRAKAFGGSGTILFQPVGKPYFIMVTGTKSLEVAKKLKS
jgi:hypothetical protein